MSISVEGLDIVLSTLNKVANANGAESGVQKACLIVETDAKRAAPKDTGALRRSIETRIEKNDNTIQGIVYTPLEYAPYVEYGTGLFAENGGRTDVPWFYKDDKEETHKTSGQKPQPFMRPALLNNEQKILDIIKGSVING